MDFVVGMPKTRKLHNSIWVIIDRMTKSAHFNPMKFTYKAEDYATLYIDEIVRWHGIPLSIISDRGAHLTSLLPFQKSLGKHMKFSTGFYPKTDGKA